MPERTRTLPLIPLDDAVVLPNMALAVSISTTEARAAIDDALSGDAPAQVVLVTRHRRPLRAHRHRRRARRPSGHAARAASRRHDPCTAPRRARACRRRGSGAAHRGRRASRLPTIRPSGRRSCAHEYRAILEEILEARGNPGVDRVPALRSTRRARWPTRPATRPTCRSSRKLELLETLDVEAAPREGDRLGQGGPRRDRAAPPHPRRRDRRHGEAAARVPAAPPAGRDPQGARRGRRRRDRGLPRRASPRRRSPTRRARRPSAS